MAELSAPSSILNVIEAIRTQVDVITTMSSGGVGAILLTWARVLGFYDDADFSGFRRPFFLVIPMGLFIVAVVLGYLAGAQVTGYFMEIAGGIDASSCKGAEVSSCESITSAAKHYRDQYADAFYSIMQVQLIASMTGLLCLAIWFAINVYNIKGTPK